MPSGSQLTLWADWFCTPLLWESREVSVSANGSQPLEALHCLGRTLPQALPLYPPQSLSCLLAHSCCSSPGSACLHCCAQHHFLAVEILSRIPFLCPTLVCCPCSTRSECVSAEGRGVAQVGAEPPCTESPLCCMLSAERWEGDRAAPPVLHSK